MPTTQETIVNAMNKANVRDPIIRNGIMAIASQEGGFGVMKPELGYAHTANDRIRNIFGSRVSSLSDNQIDALKSNEKTWFNFIYGGDNHVGASLGNRPGTDDGYNFRGRGPIQLTGRGNYTRYSKMIGHPEILDNPDLVTTNAEIGAEITIAYILDRYKGGGFTALLKAVGNNTPEIEAQKRNAFADYSGHHTYDWTGRPGPDVEGDDDLDLTRDDYRKIQSALKAAGFNPGVIDGIMGRNTAMALRYFQRANNLPMSGQPDKATMVRLGVT